jgi:hypothetical protein
LVSLNRPPLVGIRPHLKREDSTMAKDDAPRKSDLNKVAFALLQYGIRGDEHSRLMSIFEKGALQGSMLTKSAPPPDTEVK